MDTPYNIQILPVAALDLLEIEQYLSGFYPSTPAKFFKELEKRFSQLRAFPFASPLYPDSHIYRKAIVLDYIVLYRIMEETHAVQIHAIWHSSMNIQNHIKRLPF